MGYDKVIRKISRAAMDICSLHNVPFYNTATTNGFLITPDKYESMKELRINGFQITIDGNRDRHNKVKFSSDSDDSAFDTTLQNIKGYLEYNHEATLNLRVNYTHENLTSDIISQIDEIFPKEVRNRIQVNLKKVWQEKTDKGYYQHTLDFQKDLSSCGFGVNKLEVVSNYIPCYANRKYYTAVNYNGKLLKCTASDDLFSETPLGELNADGSLKWKDGVEDGYLSPSFENERCLNCKYLPMCMGVCPRNFLSGGKGCKMKAIDMKIDKGIINLIKEAYVS